ncbi:MAG TPA: hypothetical protein VGI45_12465 [Terracidiphilus sp.]|jgi:uncharacterized membrane protein YcjF (UPF0283 family)
MNHLGEEQLIELYYGEGTSADDAHLKACRECSTQFAKFKSSLDAIGPEAVAPRTSDYGDRVWQTLRPQLIPYEKKTLGWRGWAHWRAAVLLVGCAMALAVVFLGGRYWERITTRKANLAVTPQATQRVVLVVLTDHLDRTERLLVQLEHAGSKDRAGNAELQSEARELLASNRLYRVTASNAGDPELAGALDRLEGVLAEIANDPSLSAADIDRVRNDMNTKGILFEIRVLRARSSDQESGPQAAKGATI